jgi:hypothetical protein
MCNEDKYHIHTVLSSCWALTNESRNAFTIVNKAIPRTAAKFKGLRILFTSSESLKNSIYRTIKDCMNFKYFF